MQNNLLLQWFVEMIKRFSAKSPKFFQIWQFILGFLVALTGLPDLLQQIKIIHALPGWLDAIANAKLAFTLLGALVMSFQTTQSKPVAVTQEGEIIKKTDATALPFTATHETKIATKEGNNQTVQQ